jgi:LPPG:FO 2-phospho-L-lactate transferase
MGLASATAELCREYGITASVVPVTDDRVRTVVDTDSGPLDWQEWLVRDGAAPDVRGVRYSGAVDARIHPDAATALATADLLVIAPSSPVASVGPVLAVPGCTEAVRSRTGPTVALSPVSRRPVGRDRDRRRAAARAKVMAAVELGHDPSGVAAFYRGMVDELVVDTADQADVPTLRAEGTAAWSAPIVEVDELTALFAGPLDPRDLSARSG